MCMCNAPVADFLVFIIVFSNDRQNKIATVDMVIYYYTKNKNIK